MTERITISHSEADGFTSCERRHYYAFGERLESKTKSDPLQRGTDGHLLFQVFFKYYQQHHNFEAAKIEMSNYAASVMTPESMVRLGYLLNTMNGFLEFYKERILRWEIIEVEVTHKLELKDFTYAFTPDLIVRENGVLVLIDYKFTYDFYPEYMLQLSPQIPRYMGALRALGIPVEKGAYAFLRYRSLKSDGEGVRYKLEPCTPSYERMQNSFRDLILNVEPVAALRALPLEEWSQKVRRVGMPQICKYCSFKSLCVAELNGSDGKIIRATEYQRSTYGYVEDINE